MRYRDEKFCWTCQRDVHWPNDYIGPDSMTQWIIEKSVVLDSYIILCNHSFLSFCCSYKCVHSLFLIKLERKKESFLLCTHLSQSHPG